MKANKKEMKKTKDLSKTNNELKWKRAGGELQADFENTFDVKARIIESPCSMHFKVYIGDMHIGNRATKDLAKQLAGEYVYG